MGYNLFSRLPEYRHNTLSLEIRRATRAEWRQALLEEREPEWDAVLVFTRNAAGELVSEGNHDGKFEYEYDALGNLSSTLYPDGRELATLRYGTGHLLEMQLRHGGATHTLAAYGRDRLHREISRSQGVLSQETRYDAVGRVTQRTVLDARRELVFERRYRWDRTDQIVQQIHTDTMPATPGEKYSQYLWGYDAAGQVTKAVEPQKKERFFWDPAGNRTEEHRNPVWHNLLLRLDGLKLDYDGFGRLIQRRDKSGVIQHFAYDDEQRVKEIRFEGNAEFRRVEYRYDPLGRRTHKVLWRYGEKDPETIRFDWQGLQLAGEQSDREPDHYVQYVYTEGSYEPLARVDSVFDDCEIYWYHTGLNGLPERVTDADGQTVWRGQFSTWGETERELSVPQWQVPQNLRFQGKYLDRESGLHYNLFRYYDPVAGRYTQMDPIGLAGGLNTYSYVGDPLVWVDPLGLFECSVAPKGRKVNRTIYRFEEPHRIETTWTTHPGNIAASHRYTDTGLGGVYGANSRKTALAEVNAWNVDLSKRVLVSKKVQLNNVLDLTRADVRNQLGVSLKDITGKNYDVTHQIGSWAKEQGYDGILAPSARNPSDSNLISFMGL
ncbi:RHS domain-containing protein [Cronobacter sakazakii]|nr:RHS domain-containing protein [Cronobacter sakazakii]